jgi:hypothetical protein
MQIVTYPQSFRFYDCVPLIIAKYIAGKIYRMRMYQENLEKKISLKQNTQSGGGGFMTRFVGRILPSCLRATSKKSYLQLNDAASSKAFRQIFVQLRRFEAKEYDIEKLRLKKFHLSQLMNLKAKGRF